MAASWCIDAEGQVQQSHNEVTKTDDTFPSQDPATVREIVLRSHFDFDRVRELVERQPALAKASWDWGFGDWESALGAASHTGQRRIAELLIDNGARPDIFTAAMLGQLAVVRAFVEAQPGVQRLHGPHGITLMAHARAGGKQAVNVVDYLERLGGADTGYPNHPLDETEKSQLLGRYESFDDPPIVVDIVEMREGSLGFRRSGRASRTLIHKEDGAFHPVGAPDVQIAFSRSATDDALLTVHDPELIFRARRVGDTQ